MTCPTKNRGIHFEKQSIHRKRYDNLFYCIFGYYYIVCCKGTIMILLSEYKKLTHGTINKVLKKNNIPFRYEARAINHPQPARLLSESDVKMLDLYIDPKDGYLSLSQLSDKTGQSSYSIQKTMLANGIKPEFKRRLAHMVICFPEAVVDIVLGGINPVIANPAVEEEAEVEEEKKLSGSVFIPKNKDQGLPTRICNNYLRVVSYE